MPTNPTHPAPKKNVRARLMYTVDGTNYVTFDKSERVWPGFMPAYVLPATAEAFDAMALQLALVMRERKKVYHVNVEHGDYYACSQCDEDGCGYGLKAKIEHKKWCCIKEARRQLAAIGIQPAARVARSRRD